VRWLGMCLLGWVEKAGEVGSYGVVEDGIVGVVGVGLLGGLCLVQTEYLIDHFLLRC
jgi:hypothetical protein